MNANEKQHGLFSRAGRVDRTDKNWDLAISSKPAAS